ncbi:MAG: hypothetical protein WC641_02460 [Patescibacteria group bacterium]
MTKIFYLFSALALFLVVSPAFAADAVPSSSSHDCGKYHYAIQRAVDGFSIRVTDGARSRSIFYPNVYASGSVYRHPLSEIVSNCSGDYLVIADYSYGKFGNITRLSVIDPTKEKLSFREVANLSLEYVSQDRAYATTTTGEYEKYVDFFSAPVDGLSIKGAELVSKSRIASQNDALNDRSFYVFSGSGTVKRLADSNWNTTLARSVANCPDGTNYTLYEKQFAERNTAESKFPASQFLIERVSKGVRKLMPIPYIDGFWKYPGATLNVSFKGCYGGNMVLDVRDGFFWSVMENRKPFDSMTMLTTQTQYADYVNPKKSISSSVVNLIQYDGANYYQSGHLERVTQGIQGSAVIRTLLADGSIKVTAPNYFKSLLYYPVGSGMFFSKYPLDRNKVVIELSPAAGSKSEYYIYENGAYVDADVAGVRTVIPDRAIQDGFSFFTPFYISPAKEGLALKSFFVPQGLLLHGTGKTKYQLKWQRVGPLEKDGTRKIWYSMTLNGKPQTWLATIR